MSDPSDYVEYPFYVVWQAGQKVVLSVPDGERVVVFSRGGSPSAVPPEYISNGRFELELEPLPGQSYPIGVQVIPASVVPMVENIVPEVVDAMLDAALAERGASQ